MSEHYPFMLMPLPYDYSALEPYIDAKTVEVHHSRHLKAYVDNLNEALKNHPCYNSWSLEQLIMGNAMLPPSIREKVFNNAGGVYNHNFYFSMLAPEADICDGWLFRAILKCFSSFENFREEFVNAAVGRFGSGYAWLLSDCKGRLSIASTANQETNLCLNRRKILTIDVWEHAYYLKYLNRRVDYAKAIFHIFNWEKAEMLYRRCLSRTEGCP